MKRLINIELLTLKDSKKSGIIFGTLFLLFTTLAAFFFPDVLKAYFNLVNEGADQATLDNSNYIITNIKSSNDIVGYTFYIAGALKYFLALFFVSYVLKSYKLNTLKQSVADGMAKADFIKGKVLILTCIFAVLAMVTLIISFIAGSIMTENFFSGISASSIFYVAFGYFIEQVTFFSVVLLLTMFLKKSNFVLASIIMYCFCGVYIISSFLGDFMVYLPLNTNFFINAFPVKKYFLEMSINDPIVWIGIAISIAYIALSGYAANKLLNKQNLSLKVN